MAPAYPLLTSGSCDALLLTEPLLLPAVRSTCTPWLGLLLRACWRKADCDVASTHALWMLPVCVRWKTAEVAEAWTNSNSDAVMGPSLAVKFATCRSEGGMSGFRSSGVILDTHILLMNASCIPVEGNTHRRYFMHMMGLSRFMFRSGVRHLTTDPSVDRVHGCEQLVPPVSCVKLHATQCQLCRLAHV